MAKYVCWVQMLVFVHLSYLLFSTECREGGSIGKYI
jgi:hypothetical protein